MHILFICLSSLMPGQYCVLQPLYIRHLQLSILPGIHILWFVTALPHPILFSVLYFVFQRPLFWLSHIDSEFKSPTTFMYTVCHFLQLVRQLCYSFSIVSKPQILTILSWLEELIYFASSSSESLLFLRRSPSAQQVLEFPSTKNWKWTRETLH